MKKKKAGFLLASAVLLSFGLACAVGNTKTVEPEQTEIVAVDSAVLKQGAKGGEVKEVQRRLKNWGYYTGAVDGIFGANTKKAVVYFQQKNGLKADGVVGLQTYKALGMTSSYNALLGDKTNSNYTSSDLYLIAKAIYAEGRGEPYTGQVAIGAVILNRVRSSVLIWNPSSSASG